jgi:hypothetical protein
MTVPILPRALLTIPLAAAACAPHALLIPGPVTSLVEAEVRRAPPPPGTTTGAAPTSPRVTGGARAAPTALGDRVAAAARRQLTAGTPGFRDDCSGFAEAALAAAGAPARGSAADLWAQARAAGRTHTRRLPAPGDLAFFDNTYDRDGDGRYNDLLTHVAVVLEVGRDGTIVLAHDGTSQGKTTLIMNLLHPAEDAAPDGSRWNQALRSRRSSDSGQVRYRAAELWHGFATPGR